MKVPCDKDAEIERLSNGIAAYRRSERRMAETMKALQEHAAERERHVVELEKQLAKERQLRLATEVTSEAPPCEQEQPECTGGPAAHARGGDTDMYLQEAPGFPRAFLCALAERDARIVEVEGQLRDLQELVATQSARAAALEQKLQLSKAAAEQSNASPAPTTMRLDGLAAVPAPLTEAVACTSCGTTRTKLQPGPSTDPTAVITAVVAKVLQTRPVMPARQATTSEAPAQVAPGNFAQQPTAATTATVHVPPTPRPVLRSIPQAVAAHAACLTNAEATAGPLVTHWQPSAPRLTALLAGVPSMDLPSGGTTGAAKMLRDTSSPLRPCRQPSPHRPVQQLLTLDEQPCLAPADGIPRAVCHVLR